MVIAPPIVGLWYWCTDQFIVQRVLSANGIDHARRGTIFGGFLKILPVFLFVLPGLMCYALVQNGTLAPSVRSRTVRSDSNPSGMGLPSYQQPEAGD